MPTSKVFQAALKAVKSTEFVALAQRKRLVQSVLGRDIPAKILQTVDCYAAVVNGLRSNPEQVKITLTMKLGDGPLGRVLFNAVFNDDENYARIDVRTIDDTGKSHFPPVDKFVPKLTNTPIFLTHVYEYAKRAFIKYGIASEGYKKSSTLNSEVGGIVKSSMTASITAASTRTVVTAADTIPDRVASIIYGDVKRIKSTIAAWKGKMKPEEYKEFVKYEESLVKFIAKTYLSQMSEAYQKKVKAI